MTGDETLRTLAFGIAYRMLGSVAEAQDVVQEALLRLHAERGVDNAEAFLTTVTTRRSIDVLRSARRRREQYVGEWLPEPIVEPEGHERLEREETVSLGFLLLLERLTPDERAVLVLREAFDLHFAELGEILGKSADNCRQILSRARRAILKNRPRFDADPAEGRALAGLFLHAAREGDMDALVALLAPDAVLVGDGGGKARALPRPMVGGADVARALSDFYGKAVDAGLTLEPVTVNGGAGFRSLDAEGRIVNVVAVEARDGAITRVLSILNPDKLAHLGAVSDVGLRSSARAERA